MENYMPCEDGDLSAFLHNELLYVDDSISTLEYHLSLLENDKSGEDGVYDNLIACYGYSDNLEKSLNEELLLLKSVKRIYELISNLFNKRPNTLSTDIKLKIFELLDSKTYFELEQEETVIIAKITKLISSQEISSQETNSQETNSQETFDLTVEYGDVWKISYGKKTHKIPSEIIAEIAKLFLYAGIKEYPFGCEFDITPPDDETPFKKYTVILIPSDKSAELQYLYDPEEDFEEESEESDKSETI
ncbi:MAG: hypothetical protein AB9861_19145 [Methanosarcina sp.]